MDVELKVEVGEKVLLTGMGPRTGDGVDRGWKSRFGPMCGCLARTGDGVSAGPTGRRGRGAVREVSLCCQRCGMGGMVLFFLSRGGGVWYGEVRLQIKWHRVGGDGGTAPTRLD